MNWDRKIEAGSWNKVSESVRTLYKKRILGNDFQKYVIKVNRT